MLTLDLNLIAVPISELTSICWDDDFADEMIQSVSISPIRVVVRLAGVADDDADLVAMQDHGWKLI